MAVQVIPNSAQLKLVWSHPGGVWQNVLGFVGSGALPTIDQALANNLFTDVSSALTASGLASQLASTVVFERVLLRSLNSANQPEFTGTGTPTGGAGVGDLLPLSNAACVTLRTALAGKSFRGRVYISGYAESANDPNGRITTAANNAANSFVDGIRVNATARGLLLAVLSRPADAVTIPAVTRPARVGQGNAVTALLVRDTRWESQRRRTGRS